MPCDPLKLVPYETWVRCMQLYARDQSGGALPLLTVSLSWQKHLLATPKIWTTIYLDGGADERCRAECFFHLSGAMPVELVIESNYCALDLARKYSEKIKALYFRNLPHPNDPTVDVPLLSRTLDICIFPNLRAIYVRPLHQRPVIIPPSLIAACPALTIIHGAYIKQEYIPYLPQSFKMLSVTGDGTVPMGFGDGLEDVQIQFNQLSAHISEEIWYTRYFTTPSTCIKVFELQYGVYHHTLSMGRPLSLGDSAEHLLPIQAFTCTPHYELRVLNIEMPWYDICQITPYLSSFTALRELQLVFHYRAYFDDPWDVSPLTIEDVGHIRKLKLASSAGEWMPFGLKSNIPRIIRLFAGGALRLLNELWLFHYGDVSDSGIIDLLRTTTNLKELHLDGFGLGKPSHDFDKVPLNSLHTLTTYHRNDLEWFEIPRLASLACERVRQEFYCPPRLLASTLEYLNSPPSFLFEWNEFLVTNDPKLHAFPRLQTIRLTPQTWWYRKPAGYIDLSNLQTITFERHLPSPGAPRFEELEANLVLNQFMLELLFFPQNCPRLNTIRSVKYPNWALATSMLLRRNSFNAVTPISSVCLPSYPQVSILSYLVRAIVCRDMDMDGIISGALQVDETLRWRCANDFL